jgi:hypothetical protein
MKRTPPRSRPRGTRKPSTVSRRSTHTTVSKQPPPKKVKAPPRPPKRQVASRQVARVLDDSESTLLDLIDNLLAKGVVLNADLILALANVDLVYIRLSALLCAADRILPRRS